MFKSRTLINKIVLSALSFLVLFFSLALPVKAQDAQPTQETTGNWYDQNFYEWYTKVYDENYSTPSEIFGERYTAAQVQWVIYSIPSVFFNLITGGNHDLGVCLVGASWGGKIDTARCALGILTALQKPIDYIKNYKITLNGQEKEKIASNNLWQEVFADRQLSGITYFKNLGRKFHIIPRVEAAETGFGFGALGPVNELWKASRNIAYALFTIVIIVFSFMIMFRIKINPQTVISIQSSLPKIVIAMILVTFSYAIAGLMVDLMYVVMALFSALFASSSIGFMGNNPLSYFSFFSGGFSNSIGGFANLVEGPIALIIYFLVYLILFLAAVIFAAVGALAGLDLGVFLLNVIFFVFWFILIVILIINIFRIFWLLFKTVANIYITVILGPLQIALGTLVPGIGFGAWLKKLLANLAVFPAFGVLFYLSFFFILQSFAMTGKIITDNNFLGDIAKNLSYLFSGDMQNFFMGTAPAGGAWNPPWLGHASLPIAFIIMSLGCIMAVPSIAKAIETFMAGKGFEMESAIGESMGPVAGIGKTAQGFAVPHIERAIFEKLPGRFRTSGIGRTMQTQLDRQTGQIG